MIRLSNQLSAETANSPLPLVGALAAQVYDHLIHLNDEVEYLWRCVPLSITKWTAENDVRTFQWTVYRSESVVLWRSVRSARRADVSLAFLLFVPGPLIACTVLKRDAGHVVWATSHARWKRPE